MQRVSILNNQALINQDYDLSRIGGYCLAGIKEGLEITPGGGSTVDVAIGNAFIEVTRSGTPDQTFRILFENTESKNITITGADTYIGAIVARVKKDVINPSNNLLNVNGSAITDSDLDLHFVEGTLTSSLTDAEINTEIGADYFWTRIGNIAKGATINLGDIDQNGLNAGIKGLRDLEELSFSNNTEITGRNVKGDITQITDHFYGFTVDIDWTNFYIEENAYLEIEKNKNGSTNDKWKITYLDNLKTLDKITKTV